MDINITPSNSKTIIIDRGLVGPQGPIGTGGAKGLYLSAFDSANQSLISTTDGQPITINTVAESNGISVANNSKITFTTRATYSFTFSIQFENASSSIETATVWLKYNGNDYPFSASHFDIPSKHGSANGALIGTVNFVATSQAGGGDYVEVYWVGTSTSLAIKTYPISTAPAYPAAPGIILTVTQVMYLQSIS